MSINPLNDISKVYLDQVASQEVEIDEGMTMKDFKQQRSRQKQKEKRAADKIAPGRRAGIHADKASPERAARHRANVDPDFEGNDERNYPGGKLRPNKVRKAKALGELGEASHLETDMKKRREANEKAVEDMKKTAAYKSMAATAAKKFDEEFVDPEHGEAPSGRSPLQNVSDHPKASVRKAAVKGFKKQMEKEYGGKWKSRSSDPVKEALDPVGKEDADVDNDGKKGTNADKYLMKRRKAIGKAISTQEEKEVKRWWDDDGDGKGYEEGEVSGKFKKKKKIKESFSNWRQDLSEVMIDTEAEKKVTEKKVNNKVVINPKLNLGEAIENLGGTLLEMVEVDEVDYILESVYDELLEEGYEEDDIEEAIEYSLTEAKVTFGHDTAAEKKRSGLMTAAKARLSSLKKSAKQAVATGARKVAKGALKVARKVEGGDKTPSAAHTGTRKASTYRGAGAGQKERVSSGSYQAPTKKKAEKPADPWEGSATTPKAKTKKAAASKAKAPARKKKSKLDDLLSSVRSESVIGDRARNAVADQRLDDAQRETQKSVSKATAPDPVTRRSASDAAKKAERTARAMHPKPGTGGYRIEKPKPTGSKPSGYRIEEIQIDEKTLTAAETKEKERLVKSMKDKEADFEKRYPGRGKEVMYATATKMAKKIAEQAMELQPKTQDVKQQSSAEKKVAQQRDRQRQQEIQILNRKIQALRSTPKGLDTDITAGYEPEGEMIDERRKEDKVAETPRKLRDKAFELVAKSMGAGRMGVQPRGQKKVPGKKPPVAGEYGAPKSPAQKVAKRRADAQRAQDMMHSPRD